MVAVIKLRYLSGDDDHFAVFSSVVTILVCKTLIQYQGKYSFSIFIIFFPILPCFGVVFSAFVKLFAIPASHAKSVFLVNGGSFLIREYTTYIHVTHTYICDKFVNLCSFLFLFVHKQRSSGTTSNAGNELHTYNLELFVCICFASV